MKQRQALQLPSTQISALLLLSAGFLESLATAPWEALYIPECGTREGREARTSSSICPERKAPGLAPRFGVVPCYFGLDSLPVMVTPGACYPPRDA